MTETRVRAALRELAQTAPVHPDVAAVMRPSPAKRRRGRWPVPVLAGAAVALIVAAVVFLPVAPGGRSLEPSAGGPSLPERFPGFSFLQGYLDGPFGRAIALYTSGSGYEDLTFSQVIVAGADRNAYRRLEIPSEKSRMSAEAYLSPDGAKVVFGTVSTATTGLRLLDLQTGGTKDYERHPAPLGRRLVPIAMSPDSRRVAYIAMDYVEGAGPLFLLDLDTGDNVAITGEYVRTLAFSPDGSRIAYQSGPALRIGKLDGTLQQAPATPASAHLAGPHSWTPDGRYLVMAESYEYVPQRNFVFVPVADGAPAVAPIPAEGLMPRAWGNPILGWRSPDAMLLSTGDRDGTTSNLIVELNLTDRTHRTISRFTVGSLDDLAVGGVQLATALLPATTVRPDGPTDRGTWPRWAILTTLACLAPFALATISITLRRRRTRRPA